MSHIEWERGFESFLEFFGVLDEEAEREDVRQAKAKVPACADFWLLALLIDCPHDNEENGVGNRLVELARMPRKHIDTFEDKGPGNVRHLADNLAIHEVAQADETRCGSCSNGDIVQYRPDAQFRFFDVEPQGDNQAQCASMRRKALIAHKLPTSVFQKANGDEHLYEAFYGRQEIVRLVEDAMSQTRS